LLVADSVNGSVEDVSTETKGPLASRKGVAFASKDHANSKSRDLDSPHKTTLTPPEHILSRFGILSAQIDSAIEVWNNSTNSRTTTSTKTIVGSYRRFIKNSDAAKKYLKKKLDITLPRGIVVDLSTFQYFSDFIPASDIIEQKRDPSDHLVENLEYYCLQWDELDGSKDTVQRHQLVPVFEAANHVGLKELERWERQKFEEEWPTKIILHERLWARCEAERLREAVLREAERKAAQWTGD
jgi:hypothetical protein